MRAVNRVVEKVNDRNLIARLNNIDIHGEASLS